MAVHWVNYDLIEEGQKYEALITYIESHQSWAKPLKSSFFVKTDMSAKDLVEEILSIVDANDRVAAVTVDGQSWAAYGLPADVTEWMNDNI